MQFKRITGFKSSKLLRTNNKDNTEAHLPQITFFSNSIVQLYKTRIQEILRRVVNLVSMLWFLIYASTVVHTLFLLGVIEVRNPNSRKFVIYFESFK